MNSPNNPDPPTLCTTAEAAAKLRVSRATVLRALERGDLTAIRFGGVIRVRQESLDRLLAAAA